MTKHKLKAGAFIIAGVLTAGATVGHAQMITINNYSFETVAPNGQPVDFITTGGIGVGTSGPDNYSIVTNSGTRYIGTSPNYGTPSLSQTTSATAVEGDTYTLSVEIGNTPTNHATAADYVGSLEFLLDGVAVAHNPLATTETPGSGNFNSTESLTYTATAADAGKTIGVELIGPTTVGVNFDDIQLSAAPAGTGTVPEPSSWALLASGLVALLTLGRIRRKV